MSSYINILSVASVNPQYSKSTAEIVPYVRQWLKDEDPRLVEKAVRIFEMSRINKRHSIMSAEDVFSAGGIGDKNDIYVREMTGLTEKALEKALKKARVKSDEIDCIITVSCTGFMIPSLDAYLINSFRMRSDVLRLPVNEMGCAGGTSSLIYAYQYLRSNPGHKVAVVAFESPTATLQHNDHSMTNIVSAALFGDGVAAVILENSETPGLSILDGVMRQFYDEVDMMGFKMTNSGLKMILQAEVPEKIESHFDGYLDSFTERNKIVRKQLKHLLFHPGGKKIIDLLESKFEKSSEKLAATKEILYHYGNMSSATVLYVLEHYMDKKVDAGDMGLMLSFGPGFTTQMLLLKWH